MSKVKPPKDKGVPNKHLHARTTFLYQAAAYLTVRTTPQDFGTSQETLSGRSTALKPSPLALQLGSDLQQVSRKGQVRLSADLKRSMCKSCNTILVPGCTATQMIENSSKGGKKAWADVLLLECKLCGGKKRFPVGAKRQLGKSKRQAASAEVNSRISSEPILQSETILLTGTEQSSSTS